MKSALERAARALCTFEGHSEDILFNGRPRWESYIPAMHILLDTLSEPDDMMKEAGAVIIKASLDGQSENAREEDAANVWRYMAGAARAAIIRPLTENE